MVSPHLNPIVIYTLEGVFLPLILISWFSLWIKMCQCYKHVTCSVAPQPVKYQITSQSRPVITTSVMIRVVSTNQPVTPHVVSPLAHADPPSRRTISHTISPQTSTTTPPPSTHPSLFSSLWSLPPFRFSLISQLATTCYLMFLLVTLMTDYDMNHQLIAMAPCAASVAIMAPSRGYFLYSFLRMQLKLSPLSRSARASSQQHVQRITYILCFNAICNTIAASLFCAVPVVNQDLADIFVIIAYSTYTTLIVIQITSTCLSLRSIVKILSSNLDHLPPSSRALRETSIKHVQGFLNVFKSAFIIIPCNMVSLIPYLRTHCSYMCIVHSIFTIMVGINTYRMPLRADPSPKSHDIDESMTFGTKEDVQYALKQSKKSFPIQEQEEHDREDSTQQEDEQKHPS